MIKLCVTEKNNAINPVYTQRQQFSITVNTDFQRINENCDDWTHWWKKGIKIPIDWQTQNHKFILVVFRPVLNGKLRVEYCVLQCRFNVIYNETKKQGKKNTHKIHKAQLFAYLTENFDNNPPYDTVPHRIQTKQHFSLNRKRFSLNRCCALSTKGKCDIMRTDCASTAYGVVCVCIAGFTNALL